MSAPALTIVTQPEVLGTFQRAWPKGTIGTVGGGTRLALSVDGVPDVCVCRVFNRIVRVGDVRRKALGLGAVWTNPAYRKQGLASLLVHEVQLWGRRRCGQDVVFVLFCTDSSFRFFRNRGWAQVCGTVYLQPEGGVRALLPDGITGLTIPEIDDDLTIEAAPW